MRAEDAGQGRPGGFDWPVIDGAVDKLMEEVQELARQRIRTGSREMGDVLFAVVNIARFWCRPEDALQRTNNKFAARFGYVEQVLKDSGKSWEEVTLEQMDAIWDEASRWNKSETSMIPMVSPSEHENYTL